MLTCFHSPRHKWWKEVAWRPAVKAALSKFVSGEPGRDKGPWNVSPVCVFFPPMSANPTWIRKKIWKITCLPETVSKQNFVSTLLWNCWKRGRELSTLCCTPEFNKMSFNLPSARKIILNGKNYVREKSKWSFLSLNLEIVVWTKMSLCWLETCCWLLGLVLWKTALTLDPIRPGCSILLGWFLTIHGGKLTRNIFTRSLTNPNPNIINIFICDIHFSVKLRLRVKICWVIVTCVSRGHTSCTSMGGQPDTISWFECWVTLSKFPVIDLNEIIFQERYPWDSQEHIHLLQQSSTHWHDTCNNQNLHTPRPRSWKLF